MLLILPVGISLTAVFMFLLVAVIDDVSIFQMLILLNEILIWITFGETYLF